uniref:Mitochondrial fission regulator 2 n=1 Tax=Strigamia maritima TaxID=126957 RepID=T1J333_STRMM
MAYSLQVVAVIQRMFESVVEVYLDIEDIVRFFMEQSGTQRRIRQLKSCCTRNLTAQRRYLIRILSDYLPIKSITTVKKQNSSNCDQNANFNALRTLNLFEASQNFHIVHRLALTTNSMQNNIMHFPILSRHDGPRCSTPINHKQNAAIAGDTSTMAKITALEEELANLRSQIASILQQSCKTSDVVSRGSQLPPPPPPPPPPLPPMCGSCFEGYALKQQIKMNKESNAGNKRITPKRNGVQMPNMTDVLKGMNKVKLRPIQRSPGGTPIRPKNNTDNNDDLNAALANALKNRLSRMCSDDSPHKNSGYSSSDNSMSHSDFSSFNCNW